MKRLGKTHCGVENSGEFESSAGGGDLGKRHEIVVAYNHRRFSAEPTRFPVSADSNILLHHVARHPVHQAGMLTTQTHSNLFIVERGVK